MYPDTAENLFKYLKKTPASVYTNDWNAFPPAKRLWLVARVDPLEGFQGARKIWGACYNTFDGPVSPSFVFMLDLLEEFAANGGRLNKQITSQVLDGLSMTLKWEEREYSESSCILVQALEYAQRVNKNPGWYPGTAFDIYRAAVKNQKFSHEIAETYLERPVF